MITKAATFVLIVSVLFFVIRVVPYVSRPTPGFLVGYSAAKMLAAGVEMKQLYDRQAFAELAPARSGVSHGDVYTANTPVLPFLFLPFSLAPAGEAKAFWELFSLACVLISLGLLYEIFHFSRSGRLVLTACAFAFTPLYFNFVWGQLYAFLLLLHVLIFRFWRENRTMGTAITLALLLLLKGYGLPFLVLAVVRREYGLLLRTAALALGGALLSAIFIGFAPWIAYSSELSGVLTAIPASATFQQTIGSLLSWCFARDEWHIRPPADLPFVVRPLLGACIAAGIFVLARLGRRRGIVGFDMAFSAAIIVNLLTAPLLFDYHYTLLLIPLVACCAYLPQSGWEPGIVAFGVALLLLLPKLPYYDDIFQKNWYGIFAFPRVYGSLILLWICGRISGAGVMVPPAALVAPA